MKKFGMFLIAVAVVALVAATSQAALLSLYTFDNTTNNAVSGAPNGTLVGAAGYVAGAIGNAVSTGGSGTDRVDITGALPAASAITQGTITYWVNTTVDGDFTPMRLAETNNSTITTSVLFNSAGSSPYMMLRADNGNESFPLASDTATLNDGAWHQITQTWSLGATAGANQWSIYVDGVSLAVSSPWDNTLTSGDAFLDWTGGSIGACNLGNGSMKTVESWASGSVDDFGVWSNILTATEAKTVYSLGTSLAYNAKDAESLFDLFAAGSGTALVGGQTWAPATGLVGAAGDVGANYVVLDGVGGGVQVVPEPGTLSLLLAGAIGLLVFAWRKRK